MRPGKHLFEARLIKSDLTGGGGGCISCLSFPIVYKVYSFDIKRCKQSMQIGLF